MMKSWLYSDSKAVDVVVSAMVSSASYRKHTVCDLRWALPRDDVELTRLEARRGDLEDDGNCVILGVATERALFGEVRLSSPFPSAKLFSPEVSNCRSGDISRESDRDTRDSCCADVLLVIVLKSISSSMSPISLR